MELTQDDVIQIIKLLDESNFDEIHFEKDGLKITMVKGEKRTPPQKFKLSSKESTQVKSPEQTTCVEIKEAAIPVTPAPFKDNDVLTESERAAIANHNLLPIKASMLGIFYRSPKPGAPPFVDIGSFVKEDTTVCLIEVMKCFTPIKAKIPGGTILKILAQDGQMVEYGQELFLVKPPGDSKRDV